MAVQTVKRPVTREEYRKLPEGPPYYELVRGELREMTRASRRHNRICSKLWALWENHLVRQGGDLQEEPNLYLPGIEEVYHPDLVYMAPARLGICQDDGIYGVPDVIVEVLSPSTDRLDRHVKLQDTQRTGVPHVWLVLPDSPVTVEEYVLGDEGLYRLQEIAAAPAVWTPTAFPGWEPALAELEQAAAMPQP